MRPQLDPDAEAALVDLAGWLEARNLRTHVYVHDGMMVALTHRDEDTTATVDGALVEGSEIVERLAAEIAEEKGLPEDWLAQLGDDVPPLPRARLASVPERSLLIVVRTAARLAERCVSIARRPHASPFTKPLALAVIRTAERTIKLERWMPTSQRCLT